MIVNSITPNLFETIRDELYSNNIPSTDTHQIRYKNYIVNTSFTIQCCLVLSNGGEVLDGFVASPICNYLYKGKTFAELLGLSGEYPQDISVTARPIPKELYIGVSYYGPIHPSVFNSNILCGYDDMGDFDANL
jgi:hypothetical protein